MSFFPVKYFLKKFFPAAWFGGRADTGGQHYADMACTMTGSGTMTGEIHATGTLSCTIAGSGSMSGDLSAAVRQVTPPITISAAGGWHSYEPLHDRPVTFADMTATMTGSGRMIGALRASGALTCTMAGKGSMRAMPIIDITRLLQRRRDDEEMMALLMAVG